MTKGAEKWIEFELLTTKAKTEVWGVISKQSKGIIGTIKWFPNWRHYCFFPEYTTVFSDRCLIAIGNFVENLNKKHEMKKIH